jgi:hypothetical protein
MKPIKTKRIYEDVIERYIKMRKIKVSHCISCHEDKEEFGIEMCEIEITREKKDFILKREVEICCQILNILDDNKLLGRE